MHSEIKIKRKETNIHKFYINSKNVAANLLGNVYGTLALSFSPVANFSLFEYLFFSSLLIFRYILTYDTKVRTEKQLYYHKD